MTTKYSFGSVNLDVNPGEERSAEPLDPETPFRILVMGHFGGQSRKDWKPVEIDRDNYEEVLAGVVPEFSGMRFRGLNDFHPDRIYQESQLFQALREVREKLEQPATFGRAADEIRGWSQEPTAPAEPERPALPDLAPGGSWLDSIVEATEPKAPERVVRRGELQSFVESVVAPHLVPAESPELPRLRAQVDAELGARMRALLHHTRFQALEAAWRAVFRLVREVETGSELKVYLLDVSKAELAADLVSADDPRESRIGRVLRGDVWSAVAANYVFARTVDDAEMLGRLARIMSIAGAPFLAEADPGDSANEEAARRWEKLRESAEARWIGLAMPRFLLRLPYGKKTDCVESFDFEEMPGTPAHPQYLWGNPAFACVQLLAEAFGNDGWEMRPGVPAEIGGLPVHVYEADGETQAKPCAEVLLTERDIDWIMDQGYMALASIKGRDAARLVRFQSIAKPLARLAARWE